MARYTGLSEDAVDKADLRIDPELFATAEVNYPFIRRQSHTVRGAVGMDYVDQDVDFNDLAFTRDRLRVARALAGQVASFLWRHLAEPAPCSRCLAIQRSTSSSPSRSLGTAPCIFSDRTVATTTAAEATTAAAVRRPRMTVGVGRGARSGFVRSAADPAETQLPVRIVTQGVLTRSVRDTANFYAGAEAYWRNPRLPPVRSVEGPGRTRLRIGVLLDSPNGVVTDDELNDKFLERTGMYELICGEGRLLNLLLKEKQFTELLGLLRNMGMIGPPIDFQFLDDGVA